MTSQIKIPMIVGGLCTEWYWERWHLAMITARGKVRYTYLPTRQMQAVLHPYQNLGLVSPDLDYFALSHHAN